MTEIEDIKPPWVQYQGSEPLWGGWRQGTSEAWLRQVWLPFWRSLSTEKRARYLDRWPPPSADWRTYLTVFWK